jgi:hypothetical protein
VPHTPHLVQSEEEVTSLKACLSGFSEQLQQLQDQLVRHVTVEGEACRRLSDGEGRGGGLTKRGWGTPCRGSGSHQPLLLHPAPTGARASASEGRVASLATQLEAATTRLDAAAARLSGLEAAASDTKQQLLDHQHTITATAALATAAGERSSAAEEAALAAAAAATAGKESAAAESAQQLAQLQHQYTDLSGAVTGLVEASQQAAAVRSATPQPAQAEAGPAAEDEETWLAFMESTSACLATHEAQLEELQALLPKVDGVVAQRAQLINLTEQVAALQSAFSLAQGPSGGNRCVCVGGGVAGWAGRFVGDQTHICGQHCCAVHPTILLLCVYAMLSPSSNVPSPQDPQGRHRRGASAGLPAGGSGSGAPGHPQGCERPPDPRQQHGAAAGADGRPDSCCGWPEGRVGRGC